MRVLTWAISIALLLVGIVPTVAHPHIFIDAKATITFNDAGEVTAIHNQWTFDEGYSAWSVQGLDTDNNGQTTRAELQELADVNMEGLSEYSFYTFAGEGDRTLTFAKGSNPTFDYVNGQTTLNFDVALDQPYGIANALEIAINDPEYYVSITFPDAGAVTLVNAPEQCSVGMEAGHTMPDAIADQLYALPPDVTALPSELATALRGVQGAILVNCPGGSTAANGVATTAAAPAENPTPETALAAVNELGSTPAPIAAGPAPLIKANSVPFDGPPPEPGLNMPRTGVLGWVAKKQREFYQTVTVALGELKTDWTAFWVLGGLSFLYGVFHAAGPGHGKVVISSYLLANRAQVRRGILLSFLSAMMQSAVAIAFVLVAASVLGLTSMAMSEAANWIGIASYAMIALLGLWLMVRKLFGWGHHHSHKPVLAPALSSPKLDMRVLARQHLGTPQHALAVGGPPLTSFELVDAAPDRFGRLPADPHYGHSHGPDSHDHSHCQHAITPDQLSGSWTEQLGVVLAVGLRPCSGALVILAFALSQNLLPAGIAAVVLMGLGTALTTGVLASLAVGAKGFAQRFAGADDGLAATLISWGELLAAFAVFAFGMLLLLASF